MDKAEWIASETRDNRPLQWIVGDDTGASSEAIWAHMMGVRPKYGYSYPLDGGDLGRCIRLLRVMPEWAERMPELAARSKEWTAIVAHWDELLAAYEVYESAKQQGKTARAHIASGELYDRMRAILDPVRKRGLA